MDSLPPSDAVAQGRAARAVDERFELDEAHRFLDALLIPRDELLVLQSVDDAGTGLAQPATTLGALAERVNWIEACQRDGHGVYFCVNATRGRRRREEDVVRVRALSVDLDGAALDPLLAAPVPPHVVVETSPGKWHAYWIIADAVPLDAFTPAQRALAETFEGDPSCVDLARVLRLPGTLHLKGTPHRVRVVSTSDHAPLPFEAFVASMGLDLDSARRRIEQDAQPWPASEIDRVRAMLAHVPADDYGLWMRGLFALRCCEDEDAALALAHEWSAQSPKYRREALDAKWATLTPARTGLGSIEALAFQHGYRIPATEEFDALPVADTSGGSGPPAVPASRSPRPSRGGSRAPMQSDIVRDLMSGALGYSIAFDPFTQQMIASVDGGPAVPLTDAGVAVLYGRCESFYPRRPPREDLKGALRVIESLHQRDQLTAFAESLQWDGVPRIERLVSAAADAYIRTAPEVDRDYACAVARYMMTALAARAMVPGHQADMIPVLLGPQGIRKTSSVKALSPFVDGYVEINLRKDDADIARSTRGRVIAELGELVGLSKRDSADFKAWASRTADVWPEKYKEYATRAPRRFLIVGTSNRDEFLDDETGARRFLPVRVVACDPAAIERDRLQLWAEGVAVFRASGLAWEEAARLAPIVAHEAHRVVDSWEDDLRAWLSTRAGPVSLRDALVDGIGKPISTVSRLDEIRATKALIALGWTKRKVHGGLSRWVAPDGHRAQRAVADFAPIES